MRATILSGFVLVTLLPAFVTSKPQLGTWTGTPLSAIRDQGNKPAEADEDEEAPGVYCSDKRGSYNNEATKSCYSGTCVSKSSSGRLVCDINNLRERTQFASCCEQAGFRAVGEGPQ